MSGHIQPLPDHQWRKRVWATNLATWRRMRDRTADALMPDAMRVTADGEHRSHLDRCDGECHEVDYDDCVRCSSGVVDLMCYDCVSYAMQDAEVSS